MAIYARVSSQQQAKEGTIDSQVAALRERVAADGWRLDEERCYLDDGVSGSTLVRPALERLRDAAYAGEIDRLYVHSPDRLARQVPSAFQLEIRNLGPADETFDLTFPAVPAGFTVLNTGTQVTFPAEPQLRAAVGAGNVRATVVNGRLVVTGGKLLNNIRIEAGSAPNSLCIIGNEGTAVNGRTGFELFTGVASVFVTMSGASDSVFFDGSTRPITLHGDLTVRMNSTRDTLRLDHVTVEGKTRVRTGRGRDLVELVDTVLTRKSSIFTGRGDDTLRVHTSQFLSDILFDGYLGTDILDAGTGRRPNPNGNLFARSPQVEFETLLT